MCAFLQQCVVTVRKARIRQIIRKNNKLDVFKSKGCQKQQVSHPGIRSAARRSRPRRSASWRRYPGCRPLCPADLPPRFRSGAHSAPAPPGRLPATKHVCLLHFPITGFLVFHLLDTFYSVALIYRCISCFIVRWKFYVSVNVNSCAEASPYSRADVPGSRRLRSCC